MRALDEHPLDLLHLSEPPRLVIDGLGHTSKIRSAHYTADGRSIVTAGYDKTIRLWSAATGELKRTIRGEIGEGARGRIYATSLSAGDEFIAAGGWLGRDPAAAHSSGADAFKIRIIDLFSGETQRLLGGHTDVILALAFAHHSSRLVSGGGDHRAIVWDARTGAQLRTLYGHNGSVLGASWSPDDSLVATASADQKVRIFTADTGQLSSTLVHDAEVRSLSFTPSGRSVVTGGANGDVRIWDAKTGQHLKFLAKLGAPVGHLSLSPDGLLVLVTTAGAPFTAYVYNINSGERVTTFSGHDNVVLASAISPNGRWAVTAGGSEFELEIWDLQTGARQVHTKGHGLPVWNVGFAREGDAIAWGQTDKPAQMAPYQLNGPLTHRLDFKAIAGELTVSHIREEQGQFLRAQEKAGAIEVRTASGKEHEQLDIWAAGRRVTSVRRDVDSGFVHRAFSLTPNGKLVVSGGDNGVLTSYETASGRMQRAFVGHTGDILAVSISPDGSRLLSGASDQTVRLWDVASGDLLLTVFHAQNGEWVAYTPAGYYASSAFGDGYVGWHANHGPDRAASFFPANILAAQLRYGEVVLRYIGGGGDIEGAITACNRSRPPGSPQLIYYRFADLPQFAPPDVYYLSPGSDLRTESDRIEITARAHSPTGEPITDLFFLVNGRPVDARWRSHVGSPRLRLLGQEAELTAVLPLPEKLNRISVIAKNRFNQSEPISFEIERVGGAKELEKLYQPELYLLAIGISDYGSPRLAPLSYAHEDAKALASSLQKQNRKLYKRVEPRVLTEREASQRAIRQGFSWIRDHASQKDLAVIFLSGYSAKTPEGTYYFLPHDADPTRLDETALGWEELRDALSELPARTILLLDSSHAGALTSQEQRSDFDLTGLFRGYLTADSSVVLMSSSAGTEASYESDAWKHGAFTKALLDGLAGRADYDQDRRIFVRELEHYVKKRVGELTRDLQHPTATIPTTLPNFAISDR